MAVGWVLRTFAMVLFAATAVPAIGLPSNDAGKDDGTSGPTCAALDRLADAATAETPDPAAAQECPLDHMIFRDTTTGREFVATRVAVRIHYDCPDKLTADFDRPQPQLEGDCKGPYGETIIEGRLDGRTVYAVYKVEEAVPCCVWYSHPGTDRAVVARVKHWLKRSEIWTVEFGDAEYTIGQPNPPFAADRGPLANAEFKPSACRADASSPKRKQP